MCVTPEDETVTYGRSPLNRLALLLIIVFAVMGQMRAVGQTTPPLMAFTLERRVTDKDKAGREFPERTEILYVSSSGNWHYESTYSNGQKLENICVVDKGVFFPDHNRKRLIKLANSCRPSATTRERLEADSKFVRTEAVLDRLAYLHRRDIRYVEETYFVPELGPFPFKRISYLDGYTLYEEPVRLFFGEPEPSQIMPHDYTLMEQIPERVDLRIKLKPDLQYPAAALSVDNISGDVLLDVTIDESGQVIRATIISNVPPLGLAALEAIYRARFTPVHKNGKLVCATGIVTYSLRPDKGNAAAPNKP